MKYPANFSISPSDELFQLQDNEMNALRIREIVSFPSYSMGASIIGLVDEVPLLPNGKQIFAL